MDLDNPPHTVTLLTQASTEDDAGYAEWKDDLLISVTGLMLPISSKEANLRGISLDTTYVFRTKASWPGGAVSEISWKGRKFDQEGAARTFDTGEDDDHTVVILKEIAPAVN